MITSFCVLYFGILICLFVFSNSTANYTVSIKFVFLSYTYNVHFCISKTVPAEVRFYLFRRSTRLPANGVKITKKIQETY